MTVDVVALVVIPGVGAVTVALPAGQRRTGYVLGLASQPFWLVTAVVHRQWGVVVSAAICTVALGDGLWRTRRSNSRGEAVDAGGR